MQIDTRRELRPAELSDTGLRELRKLLADLNLRVGSVVFPTRRGLANPVDLQPRLEGIRAAMQLASQLSGRFLISTLGQLPAEEDTSGKATLDDAVTSLAAYGDRIGVQLVLQSADSATQLENWINSLPSATCGLDLHPGSLVSRGESPAEFIEVAGRHIAHVHAADGVYDLASRQGVEVELGRGTVDFPQLLGLLEEFEYRDWLTVERQHSQQPLEDIRNAVKYLRSL